MQIICNTLKLPLLTKLFKSRIQLIKRYSRIVEDEGIFILVFFICLVFLKRNHVDTLLLGNDAELSGVITAFRVDPYEHIQTGVFTEYGYFISKQFRKSIRCGF